jgi:hypothetical protein
VPRPKTVLRMTPMSDIRVRGLSSRPTRSSRCAWVMVSCRLITPADACSLPKEDVLGNGQDGHQRELLVDDPDTTALAGTDVLEIAWPAVEDDLTLVAAVRVDAAEHLHQRRLACAVLTADGVDLAVTIRYRSAIATIRSGCASRRHPPMRSSSASATWGADSGWWPTKFESSNRRQSCRTCRSRVPFGNPHRPGPPRPRRG